MNFAFQYNDDWKRNEDAQTFANYSSWHPSEVPRYFQVHVNGSEVPVMVMKKEDLLTTEEPDIHQNNDEVNHIFWFEKYVQKIDLIKHE